MFTRSNTGEGDESSVRNFATYLAGSQYCTCESHSPVVTSIAG